jgi:hypothetical protein
MLAPSRVLIALCCLALFCAINAWAGQATLPPELEAAPKKTSKKPPPPETAAPAPATTPAPPVKDTSSTSSNNGRFKRLPSGVIQDTSTNLEWFAGVDLDHTADMAKGWASSLKESGGGWRLPTRSELAALLTDVFQTKTKTGRCEIPLPEGRCRKWVYTGAVELITCGRPGVIDWPQTCGIVWTSERRDEHTVWNFNFATARMGWGGPPFQLNSRALAVRQRR